MRGVFRSLQRARFPIHVCKRSICDKQSLVDARSLVSRNESTRLLTRWTLAGLRRTLLNLPNRLPKCQHQPVGIREECRVVDNVEDAKVVESELAQWFEVGGRERLRVSGQLCRKVNDRTLGRWEVRVKSLGQKCLGKVPFP